MMDERNFVAPDGTGGYVVFVDGQLQGYYPDQGTAERAYNTARGYNNGSAATQPPPTSRPIGTGAPPGYGFPVVGGMNQLPPWIQGMDEAYKERYFNEYLQPQRQFDEDTKRASMTGYLPSSWRQAQMGGAQPNRDQALDAIWKKRADLESFYKNSGWDVSTPEAQRKATTNWLGMTDDQTVRAAGGDPFKAAKALGINTSAYRTNRGTKTIDQMRAELAGG